jgi:hypothetical protein
MTTLTLEREPLIESVEVGDTRLTVTLVDGRSVSVPLEWYPRLQHGSADERGNYELIGGGHGIHWPDLDEDINVEGILAGRRSGESERSLARWLTSRPAATG